LSSAICITSTFQRVRLLCQPTSDWGPANRQNISSLTTYESVRNTIVLVNGLPVIQESLADSEIEDNRLWEWAYGRSSNLHAPLQPLPLPQVKQKPGPSILKNPGGGTKPTTEEPHIQQVIIKTMLGMADVWLQCKFKRWKKTSFRFIKFRGITVTSWNKAFLGDQPRKDRVHAQHFTYRESPNFGMNSVFTQLMLVEDGTVHQDYVYWDVTLWFG
jgi:hypothetical protein